MLKNIFNTLHTPQAKPFTATVFVLTLLIVLSFFTVENIVEAVTALGIFFILLPQLFLRIFYSAKEIATGQALPQQKRSVYVLSALIGSGVALLYIKLSSLSTVLSELLARAAQSSFVPFVLYETFFVLPLLLIFTYFTCSFCATITHGTALRRFVPFVVLAALLLYAATPSLSALPLLVSTAVLFFTQHTRWWSVALTLFCVQLVADIALLYLFA